MRKALLTFPLLALGLSAAEMTGYISDSYCGAKNANSSKESAQCAKDCVKNGADPVFVDGKNQKVYVITNKDKALNFIGAKVILDGTVKGDHLVVASVKPAV